MAGVRSDTVQLEKPTKYNDEQALAIGLYASTMDKYFLCESWCHFMSFILENVVPWGRSFDDKAFDIALCSHPLFLYSEQLTEAFHLAALKELCRVAAEARIFPLLELGGRRSRHLEAVTQGLATDECAVNIPVVQYEFQRGANQMMCIKGNAHERE